MEDKKKRGRPLKYSDVNLKQVNKLAGFGLIDTEIADYLGIVESTFYKWKNDYPEFSEALKTGKLKADAKVIKSLHKRALGYKHPEDKIFIQEGSTIVVPTIKHYPPDTTAIIYWLSNRQPDKWKRNPEGDGDKPKSIKVVFDE